MKNLCFLLFLIGFFNTQEVLAQAVQHHSLEGIVTNSYTNEPLIGTTIYIPDIKTGAVSDEKGHYAIIGIPSGTYLVEVRYTGYATISEEIQIKGLTRKNWHLLPAIVEGNEVVITGVSKATEVRKHPTHISVLNHLELQHTASSNIIGKIAELPGVSTITTGPDVMKPVIRGLSYNRVVVVNNGIRQEGQQWGDEHGVEIDDYTAGRIEVLRGASSLMYGSDALGGVVNILPSDFAPMGHIKGGIISNFQTNNGLVTLHGDARGNQRGITWHAYGTAKQAHDYKNKYDGYVFNSKFRERNFGGGIGINRSWAYSHLSFSSYNLRLGLPEGERDDATGNFLKEIVSGNSVEEKIATHQDFMSYHPFIGRQRVQHNKFTWDNRLTIGNSSLAVTFGYQQNHRREYEDVLSSEVPGLYMKLNTFNYNIRYSLPGINNWHTTFGINGMQQVNKNEGNEVLIPEYHLFDMGMFGITQKSFDKLTLSGGLRYDIRLIHSKSRIEDEKTRFSAFDKHFSSLSGSAGLSYEITPQWLLKANIARGFRSPSIPELAANGVHEGTLRYELGNQNLKPENSTEFDIGTAFNSTHVTASIYGYYTIIQHYIYSSQLQSLSGDDSVRTTEDGTYKAYQFDQTNAHLYGTEASIDIHPHPLDWLHFKNTFSFVRGVNAKGTDSTRNLPKIPAARWQTELGVNFHHAGNLFSNVYLTLKLNQTFKQSHFFEAYHTETATPAYTILNVEAGTDIINKKEKTLFSIFLSVENLTNVAYQDHLSRFKYLPENYVTGRQGIFNMGRNVSFKVEVPLDFH